MPAVDFRESFALMSAFTFTVCGVIAVLVLLGFNSMLARYCAPRAAQREQQVGLHRHSIQTVQYWHISYSALLGFAFWLRSQDVNKPEHLQVCQQSLLLRIETTMLCRMQRGSGVPLERPYKPPAWQEAVCITNPDG